MRLSFITFTIVLMFAQSGFGQVNMNELYSPFPKDQVRRSPIRAILNDFTLSASSGYNYNFYKADLKGYDLVKINEQHYLAQLTGSTAVGSTYNIITDWINQPQAFLDTIRLDVGYLNGDTNQISFRGYSYGIPLNLSIQYNIWKFRIGGGASFEYMRPANLEYGFERGDRVTYTPNFKSAFIKRYYGHLSFKIRDYWDYTFWADIQIGVIRRGKHFDPSTIQSSAVIVNIGAPVEYNFSEYFRLSARPFVEFKNYTSQLTGIGESIKVSNPTFGIQLGISYNYPEVGRCRIGNCQVQLKHIHNGKEFRGQPITKKQNPKVGENHPKLLKYKGKNKRMLNPY
jgi:hypothetical protein